MSKKQIGRKRSEDRKKSRLTLIEEDENVAFR